MLTNLSEQLISQTKGCILVDNARKFGEFSLSYFADSGAITSPNNVVAISNPI